MKVSIIAALAIGSTMLSAAPVAFAGTMHSYSTVGETADCPPGTSRSGDGTCLMSSGGSMGGSFSDSSYYGGSTYSMGSTVTTFNSVGETADCPPGTSRSGDGTCMMSSGGSMGMGSAFVGQSARTYGGSSSSVYVPSTGPSYASAPLGSYQQQPSYVVDPYVTSTMSDSEADYRYGSGSISQTYTDGSNTIVPFTTTSATLSNYRVPGMGANEFLSPTTCPVSVYNPEGAQVLGCYQVSKPAPVRVRVPTYHHVRVVRPIIYVRYPVPTPVPMPMPVCGNAYGHGYGYHQNQWGRRCGW